MWKFNRFCSSDPDCPAAKMFDLQSVFQGSVLTSGALKIGIMPLYFTSSFVVVFYSILVLIMFINLYRALIRAVRFTKVYFNIQTVPVWQYHI